MLELCLATFSDAPRLAELERECFSDPWSELAFASSLIDNNTRCLLAKEGDRLVGYVLVSFVFDRGQITNVAVAPSARRQGVARQLLTEVIRLSREQELAAVELEVRAGNVPAISLYSSLGFVEVGRRKNYYRTPTEDAILMDLVL